MIPSKLISVSMVASFRVMQSAPASGRGWSNHYRPIQLISSPTPTHRSAALPASLVLPAPTVPKQQQNSGRRPAATSATPPPPSHPVTQPAPPVAYHATWADHPD